VKSGSLPAVVLSQLRRRFDALAQPSWDDHVYRADLPGDDVLAPLLEEVLWASVSRDEGRECRFTVAYYPELKAVHGDMAIALEPEPFDRDSLRRLAAVAFAADAAIAVCLIDAGLRIVGLCKHLRAHLHLAHVPTDPIDVRTPIEIEARGPAHIIVRYGMFRILTYENGAIAEPGPNVLDVKGPFRNALEDLAVGGALSAANLRFHLRALLREVDRHGHGGLIILSPSKPSGVESVSWSITENIYALADVQRTQSEAVNHVQLVVRDPSTGSVVHANATNRALRALAWDILKVSASLALTDGFLWLDGGLCPRGFGVFAEVQTSPKISVASDAAATTLQTATFRTLGARHRAMVALASRNPGCPSLAISMDGGFSAALGVSGRDDVLVWRFESSDLDADDPLDPRD